MSQDTILAITPGHPGQLEALENQFRVIRLWKEREPERTVHENRSNIVAITTFLGAVRAPLIESLPNLKIIGVGAVGVDHVDVSAAKNQNVIVTNTPDVLTDDTADMALGLMLSLSRRVVEGDAFVRAGLWGNQTFPLGKSLRDKVVGIIGLGRIGMAVAKRAESFGMSISYTGPNQKDVLYSYSPDIKDLAIKSDYLVCCCPGGAKTQGLINYDVLVHLGKVGYLINISRGSVVNEGDLLAALNNKSIAGAALDVYEREPDVPEGLFVMDNVVLTPHIGSATSETRKKMGDIVVANIISCLRGENPLNPI